MPRFQKAIGLITARAVLTNRLRSLMAVAICRASSPERAAAESLTPFTESSSFESLPTSLTVR